MVAVDVTVEVVAKYSCWEGECATDFDILRLFNFCDPSVVARLTDEQVACLIAQYNEPCEDATITINSAPFASVVSGGGLNVPVIQNGSPVGSKVGSDWVIPPCADGTVNITNTDSDPIASVTVASGGVEPYVIPNVAWTDSDGSAESTPYGDAIVCAPQVQSLTIRFAIKVTHDAFSETMTSNEAGTITNINNGGLSAFVLSKNASPVTAPFTIANGDVISATFTAAGAATTVILTGTY
jgi:hypothetical protein